MKSVLGYEYEPAAHLVVTDEDAADFLQSQFSNELRPFKAGQCTYGLWLDVKGKVIADSIIICEGEEQFRILSESSPTEVITQKLEQHIIADDVEIEESPRGAAIALIGSGSTAVLEALDLPVPMDDTFVESSGLYVYRGRRSQEPNFELWSESPTVIAALKMSLAEQSVAFITEDQVHLTRIAAAFASVPSEIGPADLPGEGGFVGHGVSISKGCYLGQEVVARMHNLGRPQRGLFRMSGSGEAPTCPFALYNRESKKIGELRSAFSTENGWIGVALLKTRYASVGESLNYDSGNAEIQAQFSAELGDVK